MADEKKIVTQDIFEKAISDVLQVVAENVYVNEEYTTDEVDNMFNGTAEEIAYYSSLINDNLVSENRLYSSKKISDEIAKAIIDSNAYADGLITNLSSIELKYVDSLPGVGNANTIYILKSTTSDPDTLNLYNEGAWIKIGDFNISLDDYYTKSEIDTKLNDKANKTEVLSIDDVITDKTQASNSNVLTSKVVVDELDLKANDDEVVKKSSIATSVDSTTTNDVVVGGKLFYDYILANTDKFDTRGYTGDLDDVPFTIPNTTHCYLIYNTSCTNMPNNLTGTLYNTYFGDVAWATQLFIGLEGSIYTRNKANGTWSSWERYLKTADLTQTINSSSTDTQVPSAKAVFTPINNIQENLTSLPSITDLNNFKGKSFMIGRGTAYNNTTVNIPNGINGAFVVEYFPYNSGENYGVQRLTLVQSVNGKYYTFERSLDNGNWMGWQRVCTTSVADVAKTQITAFETDSNYEYNSQFKTYYFVKNGVCYVHLGVKTVTADDAVYHTIYKGLPAPFSDVVTQTDKWSSAFANKKLAIMVVNNSGIGEIRVRNGEAGANYWVQFSYPVAES